MGTPIVALAGVTGLDLHQLSAMVGRQLPFFSILIPFWLIAVFCGWRKMLEIWPAALVALLVFLQAYVYDVRVDRDNGNAALPASGMRER